VFHETHHRISRSLIQFLASESTPSDGCGNCYPNNYTALVLPNKGGKPYPVRYDRVNAMLLNEFLKEHRKLEQLEKQIEALTAGLQKVTAQLAPANGAAGMRSDIDGPSREVDVSGSEQVNPSLADLR
jgi:hypothetical protein